MIDAEREDVERERDRCVRICEGAILSLKITKVPGWPDIAKAAAIATAEWLRDEIKEGCNGPAV